MPKKGRYCFNDPNVRCKEYINTNCVNYTGSNLPYIDVSTNDTLSEILASLNEVVSGLSGGSSTDEKLKVSFNDSTSGYLNGKLIEGTGISLVENNNGNNETLEIINTSPDQIITLTEGSNVTITGTYPNFTISAAGGGIGTDELVKVSNNDTTGGYLNGKLVQGTGITLVENNNGGNETFTITNSAPDQTVALNSGTGISVTGTYPNFTIASTITQYTDEMAQDTVATLIQNGTGISWSYNDVANTLTPTVSLSAFSTSDLSEGTNLYYTDERVDDRVAALLVQGTGITLSYSDVGNSLTVTNSDLGSSQNIFKNIAVSGQSTVVADSNNDTLTLIAGTNVTITTNATNDSITINAATSSSGIIRTIVTTSGSLTLGSSASTDYVYFVTGAHTMSMPAAAGNTNRYTVKNNHSANITIDTVGAESIEGASSISIAPEESVDIISDGTNWYII